MKITVTDARPLSEENEGLIITLNRFASLAIQAGTKKLGDKNLIVKDDTLFVKFTIGYLGIKPSAPKETNKLFWVDDDLQPLPGLFNINLNDIKIIVFELEEILLRLGIDTFRF